MEISEFTRTILFSSRIEDKLLNCGKNFSDQRRKLTLPRGFMYPERPARLKINHGKSHSEKFPKSFEDQTARGIALHSFANHELLALELMALCLLKFPDADPSFRRGLYFTMLEEQQHCKLYCDRMEELGVTLGDVPVNSFFWDTLSTMKTPLEFVTK